MILLALVVIVVVGLLAARYIVSVFDDHDAFTN
jgi:hypothetical protein